MPWVEEPSSRRVVDDALDGIGLRHERRRRAAVSVKTGREASPRPSEIIEEAIYGHRMAASPRPTLLAGGSSGFNRCLKYLLHKDASLRIVVLLHAALRIAHVLEPLVTPLRQLVQQLEAQAAQAHDLSQH